MASAYLKDVRKREFATMYRTYRANLIAFDPVHPLTIYLNSELDRDRDRINELAAWLQANDPKFPKEWAPL